MVVSANDKFSTGILTLDVGHDDRGGERHQPRERAAGDQRRALLRAGERGDQEHRRQRALDVQLRHAGPRRAVPEHERPARTRQVSSFTVNGQRPNSNNMTIDGVANIDTGDNGGNMATTNIDAVAEFKILTNAYQAEYGRAVGGQVQVVTKSGTQSLPRVRLLVRPQLRLERELLDQPARRGAAPVGSGKRSRRRSPRATTAASRSAARSSSPASSTPRRRSCSSSGARSGRAGRTRSRTVTPGCRPPSSGRATSRRASTATATRSPTSATTRPACPAARPTPAAASRTAA